MSVSWSPPWVSAGIHWDTSYPAYSGRITPGGHTQMATTRPTATRRSQPQGFAVERVGRALRVGGGEFEESEASPPCDLPPIDEPAGTYVSRRRAFRASRGRACGPLLSFPRCCCLLTITQILESGTHNHTPRESRSTRPLPCVWPRSAALSAKTMAGLGYASAPTFYQDMEEPEVPPPSKAYLDQIGAGAPLGSGASADAFGAAASSALHDEQLVGSEAAVHAKDAVPGVMWAEDWRFAYGKCTHICVGAWCVFITVPLLFFLFALPPLQERLNFDVTTFGIVVWVLCAICFAATGVTNPGVPPQPQPGSASFSAQLPHPGPEYTMSRDTHRYATRRGVARLWQRITEPASASPCPSPVRASDPPRTRLVRATGTFAVSTTFANSSGTTSGAATLAASSRSSCCSRRSRRTWCSPRVRAPSRSGCRRCVPRRTQLL